MEEKLEMLLYPASIMGSVALFLFLLMISMSLVDCIFDLIKGWIKK